MIGGFCVMHTKESICAVFVFGKNANVLKKQKGFLDLYGGIFLNDNLDYWLNMINSMKTFHLYIQKERIQQAHGQIAKSPH